MPIAAAPDEPGKRHCSSPPSYAWGEEGEGTQPTRQTLAGAGGTCLPRSRALRGGAGSAGLRAPGLGSALFRGGCGEAGGGARSVQLPPLPPQAPAGEVRVVVTSPAAAGSPCPSASTCPQLRAGRSLPGAAEKFGALLGLPFSPSSSLVTGVNTACFAQARGWPRPESAAPKGL